MITIIIAWKLIEKQPLIFLLIAVIELLIEVWMILSIGGIV